jgi:hypothetical protein
MIYFNGKPTKEEDVVASMLEHGCPDWGVSLYIMTAEFVRKKNNEGWVEHQIVGGKNPRLVKRKKIGRRWVYREIVGGDDEPARTISSDEELYRWARNAVPRNPSRNEFSNFLREAAGKFSESRGINRCQIGDGACMDFASLVKHAVPSVVIRESNYKKDPYHQFIIFGGKIYDSDHPEGVYHYHDLFHGWEGWKPYDPYSVTPIGLPLSSGGLASVEKEAYEAAKEVMRLMKSGWKADTPAQKAVGSKPSPSGPPLAQARKPDVEKRTFLTGDWHVLEPGIRFPVGGGRFFKTTEPMYVNIVGQGPRPGTILVRLHEDHEFPLDQAVVSSKKLSRHPVNDQVPGEGLLGLW